MLRAQPFLAEKRKDEPRILFVLAPSSFLCGQVESRAECALDVFGGESAVRVGEWCVGGREAEVKSGGDPGRATKEGGIATI